MNDDGTTSIINVTELQAWLRFRVLSAALVDGEIQTVWEVDNVDYTIYGIPLLAASIGLVSMNFHMTGYRESAPELAISPLNRKSCATGRGGYTVFGDAGNFEGSATVENGVGCLIFHTGDYYYGELKYHKRHGHGKNTFASGAVYDGEYQDDKRNGEGKFTYADGDVYEGEFKHDKYNGKGTFTSVDGSFNGGMWEDDEFIGGYPVLDKPFTYPLVYQ